MPQQSAAESTYRRYSPPEPVIQCDEPGGLQAKLPYSRIPFCKHHEANPALIRPPLRSPTAIAGEPIKKATDLINSESRHAAQRPNGETSGEGQMVDGVIACVVAVLVVAPSLSLLYY